MTINEYNELYDQMCYGHEAEVSYNSRKYFFEWSQLKLIVYDTTNDDSFIVAEIRGNDILSIVDKFFDMPIFENEKINSIYGDIEIIDIE